MENNITLSITALCEMIRTGIYQLSKDHPHIPGNLFNNALRNGIKGYKGPEQESLEGVSNGFLMKYAELKKYSPFMKGELDFEMLKTTLKNNRKEDAIVLHTIGIPSEQSNTLTEKQALKAFNIIMKIPGFSTMIDVEKLPLTIEIKEIIDKEKTLSKCNQSLDKKELKTLNKALLQILYPQETANSIYIPELDKKIQEGLKILGSVSKKMCEKNLSLVNLAGKEMNLSLHWDNHIVTGRLGMLVRENLTFYGIHFIYANDKVKLDRLMKLRLAFYQYVLMNNCGYKAKIVLYHVKTNTWEEISFSNVQLIRVKNIIIAVLKRIEMGLHKPKQSDDELPFDQRSAA